MTTIAIPDSLYLRAEQLAAHTGQPVEDVIGERLESSLDLALLAWIDTEAAELKALAYLSDDALWTIAREQMQKAKQARMSLLMDRNSSGAITSTEYEELSGLVEQGQILMRRKAEAMKLLMDRGHHVDLAALKPE